MRKKWVVLVTLIALSSACAAQGVSKNVVAPSVGCRDLSGLYDAVGTTDWVGPFKNHTAPIFYVLRRPAVAGGDKFRITSKNAKIFFTIFNGQRSLEEFSVDASCEEGKWYVQYTFGNYSDGATSKVRGVDSYALDASGNLIIRSSIDGQTKAILTRKFAAVTTTIFRRSD